MARNRFYVVWKGRNPGVYDSWEDAFEQIENFPGARYKGFDSAESAAVAFRQSMAREDTRELGRLFAGARESRIPKAGQPDYMTIPEIDLGGWAVDASCLGNPGIMEYRGVELMSGQELFRVGPFRDATNNIGEFLAIVHALALMNRTGERHTIYSDSVSGMAWVRNRRIRTTLERTPANEKVFELMARALVWLNTHSYSVRILKWQTEIWGEIPADFGRK